MCSLCRFCNIIGHPQKKFKDTCAPEKFLDGGVVRDSVATQGLAPTHWGTPALPDDPAALAAMPVMRRQYLCEVECSASCVLYPDSAHGHRYRNQYLANVGQLTRIRVAQFVALITLTSDPVARSKYLDQSRQATPRSRHESETR